MIVEKTVAEQRIGNLIGFWQRRQVHWGQSGIIPSRKTSRPAINYSTNHNAKKHWFERHYQAIRDSEIMDFKTNYKRFANPGVSKI